MNSPHNVKSLKIWTKSFFLLSLLAVTILTTVNCGRGVTRSSKLPPDDRRARYLLFPGNAETELHRAVIVNGAELSASKEITYYDGAVENHIALDKLSLFPPALPETLAKFGYKPFVETKCPKEQGYTYTVEYVEDDDQITKTWIAHEINQEPAAEEIEDEQSES